MKFRLNIRFFIRASIAVIALLFVLGFAIKGYSVTTGKERLFGLVHLFDLNAEQTLPVWYQTVTLALAGFLCLLVAHAKHEKKEAFWGQWLGLGVILAGMSVDELVSMHELVGDEMLAPVLHTEGVFNSTWLVFAIPLVLLFLISYARFFLALPGIEKKRFGLAVAVYLCGMLLMEVPENLYSARHGEANLVFTTFAAFEELFEMLGVLLLNAALLKKLSAEVKSEGVKVEFRD